MPRHGIPLFGGRKQEQGCRNRSRAKFVMFEQMNFRACLLFAFASLASAQMQMSVAQITEFIRSELARPHNDKEMAAYVKKVQLTEKLTDKIIIDLQAQGVGPKTLEALKALRDETANLQPPAQAASGPPATVEAQIPAPDTVHAKPAEFSLCSGSATQR
jgi:hypothetical protein